MIHPCDRQTDRQTELPWHIRAVAYMLSRVKMQSHIHRYTHTHTHTHRNTSHPYTEGEGSNSSCGFSSFLSTGYRHQRRSWRSWRYAEFWVAANRRQMSTGRQRPSSVCILKDTQLNHSLLITRGPTWLNAHNKIRLPEHAYSYRRIVTDDW